MTPAPLRIERIDHTALLTLDAPPANTFDRDSLMAQGAAVRACAEDPTIRALVITGAGTRFFSAGADLHQFAEADPTEARALAELFGATFETLSGFRGLTIAAINGYAMGGGLECALACDLRIAEAHAVMALPEAGVGLLPCAGGTQNLPWLVGEGWAKRMILCGERIDADTALEIGLIEQKTLQGGALDAALALAAQAARQSPPALAACKRLIQAARQRPPAGNLPDEREAFVQLFSGPEAREGVRAFLEKRQPQWKPA